MSLEALAALLGAFGSKIGIPDLVADEEGYCHFLIGDLHVHLQHCATSDDLMLFTELGELPETGREPLLLELLGADLFWLGTQGATIGVEPLGGKVFVADRIALAALDLAGFEAFLERFVGVAEHWAGRIASYEGPEDEFAAPEPAKPAATLAGPGLPPHLDNIIRG